jgi:hypothetical protein
MKKRVRVYRSGGESQGPTQEEIINYIAQKMSSDDFDGDIDTLKEELAASGINEDVADNYIEYVTDNFDVNSFNQSTEETDVETENDEEAMLQQQALLEEQEEAEEAEREAQLQAMYNTEIDMSTTEDTPEDEATYMRQGGTKPSKRSFIKQYTKYAKMAQGGDTPSPGANDVLNGREAHIKGFLGAVKNTAQDALLKEQAKEMYNNIYGSPQVGAFQDGGIYNEPVDTESPLDHLSKYGTNARHIFSDNMFTQNDVAAMEQFGGNTGQGLYKFVNGGSLNKYEDKGEVTEDENKVTEDWKTKYDELMKKQALAEQQRQIQMYMMQRYANQSGRNGSYNKAINSPYLTATGQKMEGFDMTGMTPTSVNVTKTGILGRPKRFTVNYTDPATNEYLKQPGTNKTQPVVNNQQPATKNLNDPTFKNKPFANMLMKTPGLKKLGAKMINSADAPVTVADPIKKSYIAPKTKKAYGGDISVPELFSYQVGGPYSEEELKAQEAEQFEDFKYEEPLTEEQKLLKYQRQYNQNRTYTNPAFNGTDVFGVGTTSDPILQKDKEVSQDFKNKLGKQDKKDIYDEGKLAVDFGLDQAEQIRANRQQNQMMENIKAPETTFGINTTDNKGTYDINSGLFRPDQMGFTGVAKYGGGIYAMGGNTMDEDADVQYMTEDEINDFLANGGELEYL